MVDALRHEDGANRKLSGQGGANDSTRVTKKGHPIMYDNHSNRRNYEGLFAWKPDHSESHCWGSTERHDRTFGPPVQVHKDWYGNVTKIEKGWF
jgi:hypothetical protein